MNNETTPRHPSSHSVRAGIPENAWLPDYPLIAIISPTADQDHRLAHLFHSEGLTPLFYKSCNAFIREGDIDAIDLLIIDCYAPENEEIQLLREIRQTNAGHPPCLVLYAKDEPEMLTRILLSGANDHIKKPYRLKEFLARIYRLLIRWDQGYIDQYSFGVYHFIPETQEVKYPGKTVRLTKLEFELALLYFRHAGHVQSRQVIMRKLWRQTHRTMSRSIDTITSRLRRGLALDGRNGWQLKAVYQRGYCLHQLPAQLDLAAAEEKSSYFVGKTKKGRKLH